MNNLKTIFFHYYKHILIIFIVTTISLIFYISFSYKSDYWIYLEHNSVLFEEDRSIQIEIPYVNSFKRTISLKKRKLDLANFNYSGICSKPFKYKPNNKRDLIFNTVFYEDIKSWKEQKKEIQEAISLSYNTIPFATKILYLYGDFVDKEFEELFIRNGYKIIRSKLKFEKNKKKKYIVSQRYLDFEIYMKEHQNEYDRVVLTDVRDVYWFADGFSTISPDELIFMHECGDIGNYQMECVNYGKIYDNNKNKEWILKFYGSDELIYLEKTNKKVICAGFIAGSTKKMMKFLEVMNKQLKQKSQYLFEWGYDQATLNFIYHTGKLDFLNVTTNTITQRIGFDAKRIYNYSNKRKALYMNSNGCSPIIRHKI